MVGLISFPLSIMFQKGGSHEMVNVQNGERHSLPSGTQNMKMLVTKAKCKTKTSIDSCIAENLSYVL